MNTINKLKQLSIYSLCGLGISSCFAYAEDKREEMVITASRVPLSPEAVGSALSILTSEDLENRQITLVGDALRSIPSLAVSQSGSRGSTTQIRLRGAEGNHTLVLIDGIEVGNPFTSEFDFGNLLSTNVERIEVLRGEQSVLWGSGAVGGVVNIVTKQGDGSPKGAVQFDAGAFDSFSLSANLRGGTDTTHYAISANRYDTDGINASRSGTEKDGYDNTSIHIKTGWAPNDMLEFGLIGRYMDSAVQFDSDVDFDGLIDDVDRETDSTQMFGRSFAKLSLFEGTWDQIVSAHITDIELSNFADAAFDSESDGRKVKFDYQSNLFIDGPAKSKHRFTFIAEHEKDKFKTNSALPGTSQTQEATTKAYMMEYGLEMDERFFLNAAVRRDDNDLFDDATTWSASAAYVIARTGTRLHASGGTGISRPDFFEMFGFFPAFFVGNPELKPETSTGWDIGIEQTLVDGRIKADVTYFEAELEDEIFTDFGVFPATARNETATSTRHGVEVSVEATLHKSLTLSGSYTYTQSEEDGVTEVRRPDHMAALNANYRFLDEKAQVNLNLVYNGEMEDFNFGTFPASRVTLDEYTLVSLGGSYEVAPGVSLFARAENMFDQEYEEQFGYRAPGFAAYAGFKVAFGGS